MWLFTFSLLHFVSLGLDHSHQCFLICVLSPVQHKLEADILRDVDILSRILAVELRPFVHIEQRINNWDEVGRVVRLDVLIRLYPLVHLDLVLLQTVLKSLVFLHPRQLNKPLRQGIDILEPLGLGLCQPLLHGLLAVLVSNHLQLLQLLDDEGVHLIQLYKYGELLWLHVWSE